jgi:RimJ/RimL family protein N-acetyltransferase
MSVVALRPVDDADLDALFDQMRDPASVWMAGFSAEHPDDKTAFKVHMTQQRNSPDVTLRAITCDGRLVGCVGCFAFQGQIEVTCWIDRAAWGHGIAGRALALLLDLVPARPLYARVASDNIGSLQAAQKAGFKITGTETSFARVRNSQIRQTILRKD